MSHDHHRTCQHRMYRLSCEEFDSLFAYAKGCCQFCKTPEAETIRGKLVIDHAPQYGLTAVRGLLCDKCNRLMSEADRSARYVEGAVEYWHDSWFLRTIAALRHESNYRRMLA